MLPLILLVAIVCCSLLLPSSLLAIRFPFCVKRQRCDAGSLQREGKSWRADGGAEQGRQMEAGAATRRVSVGQRMRQHSSRRRWVIKSGGQGLCRQVLAGLLPQRCGRSPESNSMLTQLCSSLRPARGGGRRGAPPRRSHRRAAFSEPLRSSARNAREPCAPERSGAS